MSSESENNCSDLCDDLIAIIVRQQEAFRAIRLHLVPVVDVFFDDPLSDAAQSLMLACRCAEQMLEPERAAGPPGSKESVRILERLDARKDRISED